MKNSFFRLALLAGILVLPFRAVEAAKLKLKTLKGEIKVTINGVVKTYKTGDTVPEIPANATVEVVSGNVDFSSGDYEISLEQGANVKAAGSSASGGELLFENSGAGKATVQAPSGDKAVIGSGDQVSFSGGAMGPKSANIYVLKGEVYVVAKSGQRTSLGLGDQFFAREQRDTTGSRASVIRKNGSSEVFDRQVIQPPPPQQQLVSFDIIPVTVDQENNEIISGFEP